MNIILLSGGSGKRLWPLSNDVRSKQFIKFFKNKNDEYESMLQRIYRQIKTHIPEAKITIATSKSQISSIKNQISDEISLSIEPCKRDTFPAISLATAYLHDVLGIPQNEAVVVCPVDPYVDAAYFACLKRLYEKAKHSDKNLVLMGIKPTYPSEKYGYIKPYKDAEGNLSYTFTEKPNLEKAQEYIRDGAFWNGGVFAYKLSYVLDKSKEILGMSDYQELYANYKNLQKISFDYAVVESEKSLEVLCYEGKWKDIGTWNTLTETINSNIIGEGTLNKECSNVHVINELGIPVLGMGLKNIVISVSPSGILVSDKQQSSYIKPYVDKIEQRVMFAEKSWGSYRVIDVEENSMTVKVTLKAGHNMNYHSHSYRDEVWTVIQGSGKTTVDGMEQIVKTGDVITMAAGCKHTVSAGEDGLQMIEVQIGAGIDVSDKKKYEL